MIIFVFCTLYKTATVMGSTTVVHPDYYTNIIYWPTKYGSFNNYNFLIHVHSHINKKSYYEPALHKCRVDLVENKYITKFFNKDVCPPYCELFPEQWIRRARYKFFSIISKLTKRSKFLKLIYLNELQSNFFIRGIRDLISAKVSECTPMGLYFDADIITL